MTLDVADLLAIAGVVFGPLLLIGGGALAWLRADIRNLRADLSDLRTESHTGISDLRTETQAALNDLRTEIRATNARLDTLTQIILTSALAHGQPTAPPEAVPQSETPRQPTPA